jgi:ubiquitin carboxyl-terminal hydrolase L3
MADFNWPPLESNPEVFTKYMHTIGMSPEWGVGEVFGFDEDLLAFLPQPIIGVIVAIERTEKAEDRARGSVDNNSIVPYYMKQTAELDNACGIIACLHACLNNLDKVSLTEGSILQNYQHATQNMSPEERAAHLEGANDFKEQHASAASEGQSNLAESQDEVKHHFIAFVVNAAGQLVELDGTKQGPHVVAEGCDDVLRGSIAEIQRRLGEGEISESMSMMTLNASG